MIHVLSCLVRICRYHSIEDLAKSTASDTEDPVIEGNNEDNNNNNLRQINKRKCEKISIKQK